MSNRVLVVDDSASIRQMVSFTMRNAGYEVDEACNGKEAVEKAMKATRYAIIITDLNMPVMTGIEEIKAIRGNTAGVNRFTPILMLTTESCNELKFEGRKAGATGWIVKPFKPAELIAVVHRLAGR